MNINTKLNVEATIVSNVEAESNDFQWRTLREVEHKFNNLRISNLSSFGDNVWDCRFEGARNPMYFERAIGGGDRGNLPLLLLLKLILSNLLGQNSVKERSARRVQNVYDSGKQMIAWIAKKGFLIAPCEGGYFRSMTETHTEFFDDFFSQINAYDQHLNTKRDKVRLLQEWWRISAIPDYLPSFLKLPEDPFVGNLISDVIPQSITSSPEDDSGWLPIPLDYAFPLANTAINYIENFSSSLFTYHKIVHEVILKKNIGHFVSRFAFYKECKAQGVSVEELGEQLPFDLIFEKYTSPSDASKFTYSLRQEQAGYSIKYIQQAAITIILFTTGMRSGELRDLRLGCCVPDYSLGVDEFYRMTVIISKTSNEYVQGQIVTIPVPKITYDAVRVLEVLGSTKRRKDFLVAPLQARNDSRATTGRVSSQSIWNYTVSFAKNAGVSYRPHPHQFRKTIAGWFVLNSPVLGPLLVMRLFSHKSLAMTELYLRNNQLIKSVRQEMLVQQSLSLIGGIANSIQKDKLAGRAGDKMKQGISSAAIFEGLTGDALGATMEQYLKERALQGSVHFLLTPLAICVFDPDDEEEKPCAKVIRNAGSNSVLNVGDTNGIPLVDKCVGLDCSNCLVTENMSRQLEQSLEFYRELVGGALKDYTSNVHFVGMAKDFVDRYTPVLAKVK